MSKSTVVSPPSGPRERLAILAAFAVIYLVWGSTFLGIRIAVQTLPPLSMAAIRFLVSGAVLLALGRAHVKRPPLRQWANAGAIGALFFFGNHSLVGTASRILPSSIVCLIVATEVPIIALISSAFLRNQPLTFRVVVGSMLGLLGVASLFLHNAPGEAALPLVPCLMVLGAAISWSIGAVISRRLAGPTDPLLRSGMQMTTGGVMLALGGLARGETLTSAAFTPRALSALVYLIVLGSVLAFACYTWLLERVRTEAVATHVFVNPLVATALGAWVGGEQLRSAQVVAGVLILASVLIITFRPSSAKVAQPEESGTTV